MSLARRMGRWSLVTVFALLTFVGVPDRVAAQACVPPEIDVSQFVTDGQVDLEAYLAAVAAANAICEGAQVEGVALIPDSVDPVSAVIGPEGGTIVVVSSNGVVFTLIIPRGALDTEVTITMRPVSLVVGDVSSVAAVHFAPEDLQFDPSATLRITFPDAAPDPLTLYRYEGVGTDITQITYSRVGDDTVTTPVPHFSGVAAFASEVDSSGGGGLPLTGSELMELVPYAIVMVGMGMVVVAARRRRSSVA
jgi:hypothetical protein